MCLLFVLVDIGRPDRLWHMIPPWGHINFPSSILAWDAIVLNLYFVVNFIVVTHIIYRAFLGRHYEKRLVIPLVLARVLVRRWLRRDRPRRSRTRRRGLSRLSAGRASPPSG